MKKLLVILLKKLELLSALSVRLTHITGKAKTPTHPKHLVDFGQIYYLNDLKKSDKVLDLGCHAGEHSFKAAKIVNSVTGLDIDRSMLAQAKSQQTSNTKFIYHNLENKLPFKSNTFTKVFFFAILEHLNKRDQVMREIKRVLKPEGILYISVPNKDSSWKRLQQAVGFTGFSDPDHKIEYSQKSISQFLTKHKFKNIKLQTTALDTPLSGIIDLTGGLSLKLYKTLMLWKIKQGKINPQNSVGFLIKAQYG